MSTTVTLTAVPSGSPAPYVDVLVDSIDVGVSYVTVWRTVRRRAMRVRGLIRVPSSSAVTTRDFEAPFGVEISYQVEQFDSLGDFVSYSASAEVTLDSPLESIAWFHNPLDPSTSIAVRFLAPAARELGRRSQAETYRIPGRSAGVALWDTRRGVEQVNLDCYTETFAEADRFDALFGGYDDDTVPIVCVRARPEMRLPPTLFALVQNARQIPLENWRGFEDVQWQVSADEVAPPVEAIIVALLDYADFTAFYATYAAFTSAYADYTEATRDYSIVGTA